MRLRIVQMACLLVLGLVVNSPTVGARPVWEDPCHGTYCTDCDAPDPSGLFCYVTGTDMCTDFGCDALYACGEDYQYAQCTCTPCPE